MSAGLLIGGKAVNEEATRVNAMNILVATPGGLPHGEPPSFLCVVGGVLECPTVDRFMFRTAIWVCPCICMVAL
jgi:hypothetical protein